MRRRTVITALVATAAVGAGADPAQAELRRLKVTLVTGQELTVNVDVPAGTPADQVQLSGLPAAVRSVVDLGPVTAPAATVSATPTPAFTPTPEPTPAATPAATPEATATATPAPTETPAASATPTPGITATPTPSVTAAPTPSVTVAPTPSVTVAPTPSVTVAPTPSSAPPETEAQPRRPRGNLRGNAQVLSGELAAPTPAPEAPASATPAPSKPSFSIPAPETPSIGVPNFFIEHFRIPPFLLPIYQAAGVEYGVRWEVLAAINEIETDYGRNLNVSSAGALGWMQFIPSSWRAYGVDANQDGLADPYNPVDAIFAAARYLRAAGADRDLRRAIFAYNHADWYVESVLTRAELISGLPADLVGSLSGLTQGRLPVAGRATWAGRMTARELAARRGISPARPIASDGRRGALVLARRGAPVVAVTDGRIAALGRSRRLGRYVVLQDAHGNAYTYGALGRIAARYPGPPRGEVSQDDLKRELALPRDTAPRRAASRTTRAQSAARRAAAQRSTGRASTRAAAPAARSETPPVKERLFAHPDRPRAAAAAGQIAAGLGTVGEGSRPLRRGSRVTAGTVLGRAGTTADGKRGRLRFEIRPAGRGAPRIDPTPILDGWKLLQSTDVYRAGERNPFAVGSAAAPSVGQILLMSKEALARRVLANPHIELYACGRMDIRAGLIDRRVLATLEFLAASGLRPTVTSLECGHSYYTASGNVSHHSSGNAVDIAAINGVPIIGNQGPGSITELTIQRLLTLQGSMKPDQIISLMTFDGTDNTYAMGDHADHIHIGWQPQFGANPGASAQVDAILEPSQWIKLIERLGEIDNPQVREQPSRFAVKATKRGSRAHKGE